jgi:hypothetical protein
MAGINRRRFLLAAATPLEFNKRLRGPILSAPTVYTSKHAVDPKGMRRTVERAAQAGVTVFALTRGDNQYDQLTYERLL